jgi:hypothetical protein
LECSVTQARYPEHMANPRFQRVVREDSPRS